ncbi:hypothetical protein [Paenibacillus abyssi]|uniref:Uncharacterized protein n=1 Tax=Paenibacillus abyssi TaxID=1340531 RepID=A0A917LGJ2_9BACL|nr:hypothetical protein [Paenibacillus abyssi]GGG21433.1 hypothetical protein GCM10010916_42700 [Paenibacillus abyssi]
MRTSLEWVARGAAVCVNVVFHSGLPQRTAVFGLVAGVSGDRYNKDKPKNGRLGAIEAG